MHVLFKGLIMVGRELRQQHTLNDICVSYILYAYTAEDP